MACTHDRVVKSYTITGAPLWSCGECWTEFQPAEGKVDFGGGLPKPVREFAAKRQKMMEKDDA